MKKRLLSLLLVLVMVLAMVPSAFAEEVNEISVAVVDGGDGWTPVTTPEAGQVLYANVTLNGVEYGVEGAPGVSYFWHHAGQDDPLEESNLGTTPVYTVTSDNLDKTLALTVVIGGAKATWTATEAVEPEPEEPEVPEEPEDEYYRVYLRTDDNGELNTKYNQRWYEAGDTVWVKASPDKGYKLSDIYVNDWYGHDYDWDWDGWYYCHDWDDCECEECESFLHHNCDEDCDCCNDWYWHDWDYDWNYNHDHDDCDCKRCGCFYCGSNCDCDYCKDWYWTDCDHDYDCGHGWWWGHGLYLRDRGDGWYTFTMPEDDVYVTAEFEKIGYHYDGTLPFDDVPYLAWYYEAVEYVYDNELMNGTDYRTFSPKMGATRGMIATILYRLDGEPMVNYGHSFSDVVRGSYYEDAVAWAAKKGIMEGYPDGTFGSNDLVTREQLISILYRFADFKGYDVDNYASLAKFYDADAIRGFAVKPMKWAVAEGLVQGNEFGGLTPAATATRAEIAQLFTTFCEEILD